MKIRQGFVSNSSSSSFILSLDEVPTSIDEVCELFFPGEDQQTKQIHALHDWKNTSDGISIRDAGDAILSQLKEARPLDMAGLIYMLESSHEVHERAHREVPDDSKSHDNVYWKRLNAHVTKLATIAALQYIKRKENIGKKLYCVEFSDDTPFGCIMEHGGAIKNSPVPSMIISHH